MKDLKLELSEEKTLITKARDERAVFLGTYIRKTPTSKVIIVKRNNKHYSQRITSGNIRMTMPTLKILQKLKEKGLFEMKEGRWIMKSLTHLIPLPDRDIILRYLATFRGLLNYYSFVDNIYEFDKIFRILRESARLTLSRKHKMNKMNFLAKYGGNRSSIIVRSNENNKRTIKFELPILRRTPMDFQVKPHTNPFNFLTMDIRTINDFGKPCASCGSDENVEMHHLKHIRTINVDLNPFDKLMAKINRKQIPLCHKCHREVHAGKYDGKSLRILKKD